MISQLFNKRFFLLSALLILLGLGILFLTTSARSISHAAEPMHLGFVNTYSYDHEDITPIISIARKEELESNFGNASETSPSYDDEFDSSVLDSKWTWLREDIDHWSLGENPGNLRILSQYGGFSGGYDVKNILVQPAPPGNFEATTEVSFLPNENWQTATIIVYENDHNFFYVGRRYHSGCEVAAASSSEPQKLDNWLSSI